MKSSKRVKKPSPRHYPSFDQLDGRHSFKIAVPDGYIDYQARSRPDGKVFYFNFSLAKEMGLIPLHHPEVLDAALQDQILETFSIQIINEYDLEHGVGIDPRDLKPHRFMATRYLQLQHPDKRGSTSGDGRGIWNGEVHHQGTTWDVMSSGTGATRLSPAFAMTRKFVKTGDQNVGYGNGYNYLQDGLSAALLSEVFHQDGIQTERTLTIIAFEGGSSINVRAGKNLFRPAHFFHHLKQGKYDGLKASVDYFIDRQIKNGAIERFPGESNKKRYERFAEYEAKVFSRIAARFESDYIFCWLDWDGDNILADGGIIDYGSVRQFGLYHRGYRYDDVERMSTNIPEQKMKARHIVQNFAQIRDFLIMGIKKPLDTYKNDPILKQFDEHLKKCLHQNLLRKIGFSQEQTEFLLIHHSPSVARFKTLHSYFESAASSRGKFKIPDGIARNAVFCMATLHREFPKIKLKTSTPLQAHEFIELIRSSYANRRDRKSFIKKTKQIDAIQNAYQRLILLVTSRFNQDNIKKTLLQMTMRASLANPLNRITGDGILHFTSSLIRNHHRLTFEQKNRVIQGVIGPKPANSNTPSRLSEETTTRIINRNLDALKRLREGF